MLTVLASDAHPHRRIRFAVLIPTRGRSDLFHKTWARHPFLDDEDVIVGIQTDQKADYRWLDGTEMSVIGFPNPEGSVGVAREFLRKHALRNRSYEYLVMTDDNARFTESSLKALVQSTHYAETQTHSPVFMAGMHGTASHFDRGAIAKTQHEVGGFHLYRGVGAIFHCVNAEWMQTYRYPAACFALEDRHLFMTAIRQGHTDFRICMDAPFTKTRYQEGGQGDIKTRMWNCGRAIEQLAHDFPEYVGAKGTFPTPWQFIISMANGATADRLVGGAMRKGEHIVQTTSTPATKPLTARVKRSK